MDASILKALDEKVTNIGTSDVYKRTIGGIIIWLSPLSYTDQKFVQQALENENSVSNVNDAKLAALSRSIVGIDKLDLRKYRNGSKVFPGTAIKNGKKIDTKVDLAKYLETKIVNWGQEFVDLAFEVFADISETSKKKFAKNVTLENTKEPLVELAELEVKVHQLRAQLGMPVLVEKPGSSYANLQGEPSEETLESMPDQDIQEDPPEPPEDFEDIIDAQSPSFEKGEEEGEEEPEENYSEENDVLSDGTDIEEVESESTILKSVSHSEDSNKPNISVPSATPVQSGKIEIDQNSPIQKLLANRKGPKVVNHVPSNAKSSPDSPLELSSVTPNEVIETTSNLSDRPTNFPVDPPISKQSRNPRFKHR